MERTSPRKKQTTRSKTSRSPSRSRSTSPSRSRSTSPVSSMESYIQMNRDPLSKIMTSFLNPVDLGKLSRTTKSFRSITKSQMKKAKEDKAYDFAKEEVSKYLDNYDKLSPNEKINAEVNLREMLKIYDIIYSDDPFMKKVIKIMRIMYKEVLGKEAPLKEY